MFFFRYPKEQPLLLTHAVMGSQLLWDILHSISTRALLDRRVYFLLPDVATLHVLPHAGQQPVLAAVRRPQNTDLVSHVLLL